MAMEIVISMILLIVGIVGSVTLAVIHVCIAAGRGFRGRNEENGGMVENRRNETPWMSSEELHKLPCFDYEEGEKGNSPVDCVICLENLKISEICRRLTKCMHSFHAECIDSWLLKTPICPICRSKQKMVPVGMFSSHENGVSGDTGVQLT